MRDELVYRYAQVWVREQVLEREADIRRWLFEILKASPNLKIIESYRKTIERYWQVDYDVTSELLYYIWLLDKQGTKGMLQKFGTIPLSPGIQCTIASYLCSHWG